MTFFQNNLFRFKLQSLLAAFLIAIIVMATSGLYSQSKKDDLQKQRDEISEKIALTKKLIKESESSQKVTGKQLAMLNEQLAYREQLLQNINSEIHGIDKEITNKENTVHQLEGQLSNLKKEYARMIVQAYKNRSAYDKMMYVFASEDFNQAYKRFKMTQHYADIRKQQVAQIEKTQSNINTNISLLQQDKQLKESLATTKEKEKNQIAENKVEQQSKLSALRKEEQKLRDQQRKQESDRKKLTAKIQEEIEKEMEAERRRAEAAAKAKAASSTTASSSSTTSSTTTAKTDNTVKATAPKSIELAPETKLANADFEKNKGGLPWPVSSGVITSHFGVQNHESLAGIVTNNNGLDFTTEREAAALAVFGGTVTSVFNIPGAGQNVIITHGTYKTVYAGLSSLNVKVGDHVSPKDKIGTVMSDGEDYTLHFEVWKVSGDTRAAQNPEVWIKKR